jgi:hypothetical protein
MDHAGLKSLARRRARARIGLIIHATVFVAVNVLLVVIQRSTTPNIAWSLFPLAGWGTGLVIHAAAVLFAGAGSDLRERIEAAELRKLQERRAPGFK